MRGLLALVFLCLPLTGLADGKLFSPLAFADQVTIPDQRALICWSNGVERLVIETRFTGSGTNFAWVVPVPAQPRIEAAPSGFFSTLEYLFRPKLIHTLPRWYLGVVGALALGYLMVAGTRERKDWPGVIAAGVVVCAAACAADIAIGVWVSALLLTGMVMVFKEREPVYILLILTLLGMVLGALMLPGLAPARSKGGGPSELVEVLERKTVGVFETVTVASKVPTALDAWLRENGYAVATNAAPVIAAYVKEGWVFVAARLRRAQTGAETNASPALSFVFPTKTPVYPMRLTGVDNGPVSLELYVFGPSQASAPGFKVERCGPPIFPAPPKAHSWAYRKPAGLEIHSSPLREWVWNTPAATKLIARLSPAEMASDVRLGWIGMEERENRVYSRSGAITYATNASSVAFVLGLGVVGVIRISRHRHVGPRPIPVWPLVPLAALLGVTLYLSLPQVPVRLVTTGSAIRSQMSALYHLANTLSPDGETIEQARANLALFMESMEPARMWDNPYLGGTIREECSPGNYLLREQGEELVFVGFDAAGAPHELQKTRLKRPTN